MFSSFRFFCSKAKYLNKKNSVLNSRWISSITALGFGLTFSSTAAILSDDNNTNLISKVPNIPSMDNINFNINHSDNNNTKIEERTQSVAPTPTDIALENNNYYLRDPTMHYEFIKKLRELAIKIDAYKMLENFLKKIQDQNISVHNNNNNINDSEAFSKDFVRSLFYESGVMDDEVIENLFNIMDWNNTNNVTIYELIAAFTLFNVGNDFDRYSFLFNCLNFHNNGSIDKNEFRKVLICLLTVKFNLWGFKNTRDPDEIYDDLDITSYHTLAILNANQMIRKIFVFADQHRRNRLNWKEFLRWCYRGGDEVNILKDLLYQTHDDTKASELIYPYRVGAMSSLSDCAPIWSSKKLI